jgi:ppGpp synthetase/RelA/SpoT-type nucleotidyltranferase
LSHPIMTDIGNIKEIKEQYNHIAPICISIKEKMQVDLKELLDGFQFIDSVTGRVKEKNSFITKIGSDKVKYNPPFQSVEDFIGLRVLVYFRDTAEEVYYRIKDSFCPNIENIHKEPIDLDKL